MTHEPQDIERAIDKLKSFSEAGDGIVEVVACGSAAIPALRSLLFKREPSGLFQARHRVVDALAALKAYDVLIEFLSAERAAGDPVERLGDDAVINYAAWAVARTREERAFVVLLRLAQRPCLSGVIGALGTFGRIEAVPALVAALEEDGSRNVAQYMLRRMSQDARAVLLVSANRKLPSPNEESVSSLRRRRTSLTLLAHIGLSPETWPQIRGLMLDDDAAVVVLACKLCLQYAPAERQNAIRHLTRLLPSADWILRTEIERCLDGTVPPASPPSSVRKTLH
jgi:HEAT repeat protein